MTVKNSEQKEQHIRESVLIEHDLDIVEGSTETVSDEIQKMQIVDETIEVDEPTIDSLENHEKTHARLSKGWFWLFILVVLLGSAELAFFTIGVFEQSDWLGAGWLILLLVGLGIGIKYLFSEFRGLRQLKAQQSFKQQAQLMLAGSSIGQGEALCETISNPIHTQHQAAIEDWKSAVEPHYLDAEIVRLFERKVLSKCDKVALQCVTKNASASAAMIAVSPFALLDMAIVLWRNFSMLKQISEAYGIKLSYWGRISLIKQVFKTMLYAGASEIIADAGNYALGAGVTGKLSTRVAQGLGAGVLTTRIGVKAMHACRPLPWIENKPPGLSKLASQLLRDLKNIST